MDLSYRLVLGRFTFRDTFFIPLLLVVSLAALFAGCTQYSNVSAVDPMAKALFEALKNGDLDKVMSMYDDEFFIRFSKEEWRHKLQRLTTELGPIKAYSFRNKQADSRFSGKFYIYQYDTIHEGKNNHETRAKHTITFIQPINSPEIKLVGHMIKAKGFE